MRDRVAGGLVAGHRQHDDEEAELVIGQLLPVDVGLDQRRDDVVGRVLAPLVGHRHRVHDQFHRRLRRIDIGELGILAAGHLVGPAEQLVAVVLRHAQQAGDGLQRQFARHLLDEVATARGGRVLGDVLGALCELLLQPTDRAGGESPGDDLAQPGVVRGVHVEHDAALQFDVLARHFLGPGRDGAVLPTGEDVAAARHFLHVGVLGEDPVAVVLEATGAVGHVDPVDRLGLAELGELRHGKSGQVDVGIEEVEAGGNVGGCH